MGDIFVTGHRNPDTDSIVAAIAYASLRRSLGDRDYKAVRLGSINDETRRMLDRFGIEAPEYVKNLRAQIKDLDYDVVPALDESVINEFAWKTMDEMNLSVLPVTYEDGRLYGMLTKADIAEFDMQTIMHNQVENLPIFNLVSSVEGHLVNEFNCTATELTGNVVVAIQSDDGLVTELGPNCIVICASHTPTIEMAIKAHVACIIICHSDVKPEWKDISGDTCIISTNLSARAVSRKVFGATPVGRISKRNKLVSFHLDDYVDDVREKMLETRYRSYPVLDENEKVVGLISRFHLLRPRRKKVVLVDHNEIAQSVPFIEQVEILEIIDHHRLADIQTGQPISFRNEPVGSTNTIIASMYSEFGVMPSPQLAGLMAAAILSDTVLFKSPTCTKKDIAMAERLCRIAKVSVEELGRELFSSANDEGKSAEQLFDADYKQFNISEQNLGVSQITCDNIEWLGPRLNEFMDYMQKLKQTARLDMVILMVTDLLMEGSHLYFVGNKDLISQAFGVEPEDGTVFLPGVISRKKQIIPMFTALWG